MVKWETRYEELCQFVANNNNTNHPSDNNNNTNGVMNLKKLGQENKKLLTWLKNQKYLLTTGDRSLQEDRIQKMRLLKGIGANIGGPCEAILSAYNNNENIKKGEGKELNSNNNINNNEGNCALDTSNSSDADKVSSEKFQLFDDSLDGPGPIPTFLAGGEQTPATVHSPSKKTRKERTWEENYAALVAYKEREGNCDVPYRYPPDSKLAVFVRAMRQQYQVLLPEKREILERLGVDFTPRKSKEDYEDRWKRMLAVLADFLQDHSLGDLKANVKHQDENLGTWWNNQKQKHRNGSLGNDRIERLAEVGATLSSNEAGTAKTRKPSRNFTRFEERWDAKFEKLEAFHKKHGHCKVPYSDIDRSLVNWMTHQRSLNTKNELRSDRKDRLLKLGFDFNPLLSSGQYSKPVGSDNTNGSDNDTNKPRRVTAPFDKDGRSIWESKFERFCEYRNSHGHVRIPNSYKQYGLGCWVSNQKTYFRKGEMDPGRADRMIQVGLPQLRERDDCWDASFEKVSRQRSWAENPRMARWITLQRVYWKWGWLDAKRKEKLDSLLFEWKGLPPSHMSGTPVQGNQSSTNNGLSTLSTNIISDEASRKRPSEEGSLGFEPASKVQKVTLLDNDSDATEIDDDDDRSTSMNIEHLDTPAKIVQEAASLEKGKCDSFSEFAKHPSKPHLISEPFVV